MKILFVTSDGSPGIIASEIAKCLIRKGHEVVVVAERGSLLAWDKAGIPVRHRGPEAINDKSWVRSGEVVSQEQPDVVVVGASSPMGIEDNFLKLFSDDTDSNIKTVAIDDNWYAFQRLSGAPDHILTIDALGERIASEAFSPKMRCTIIGDRAFTPILKPGEKEATEEAYRIASMGAEYTCILASQKWPESKGNIELTLSACAVSRANGANIRIIPRWHPKADENNKRVWDEMVQTYQMTNGRDSVAYILGDNVNSDYLATLADGYIAATGTGLRASAHARKIPICVWTRETAEKLKQESGGVSEHHPLVKVGAGLELSDPLTDIVLSIRQNETNIRANQEKFLDKTPFDPELGANAILNLI